MKTKNKSLTPVLGNLNKSKRVTSAHLRDNSVIIPSARDVGLCDLPNDLELVRINIEIALSKLQSKNKVLHAFLELQYLYGLRVSETLDIKHNHISKVGKIFVPGMKKSESRIVLPGNGLTYILWCRRNLVNPFSDLDRFYVYREYNRLGIKYYFAENGRYSVTHIFRYLAIKDLSSSGIDYQHAQRFIGHKNINNTKSYGEKN